MIVDVEDLVLQLDKNAIDAMNEGRNRAYAKGIRDAIKTIRSMDENREAVQAEKVGNVNLQEWWYQCGSCHKPIDYKDAFCRHCGIRNLFEIRCPNCDLGFLSFHTNCPRCGQEIK